MKIAADLDYPAKWYFRFPQSTISIITVSLIHEILHAILRRSDDTITRMFWHGLVFIPKLPWFESETGTHNSNVSLFLTVRITMSELGVL